MRYVQQHELGQPADGPPEGYEGHASTGFTCLRCGVAVRGQSNGRWVQIHDEWHERVGA